MQRDEDMDLRERSRRRGREEFSRGRSFRPRHGEEGEWFDDDDDEDRQAWEGRYGTESAYNEGRRSIAGRHMEGRYGEGRYGEGRSGQYGMQGRYGEGRFGQSGMEGRYGRDDRFGGGYPRPGIGRSEFREWDEGERGEGRGRRMGRDLSREAQGYGPQMQDYEWQREHGMSRPMYEPGYEGRRGRGLGPKNYTRSDDRIREDVCELLQDADIDASDIDVKVKNCEVTLEGTVHDRWSKREAEDIANLARGVKDTHNQLRVVAAQEKRGNGRPGAEMSQGREQRSGQTMR